MMSGMKKVKVRYLRNVTWPKHSAGKAGDERELVELYADKLIAGGFAEEVQESVGVNDYEFDERADFIG